MSWALSSVLEDWPVEELVPADLPAEELAHFADMYNQAFLELTPRMTPFSPETIVVFLNRPGSVRNHYVARDDDQRIVGYLGTSKDTNDHLLQAFISVVPEKRGRGLGTQLARYAARIAAEESRRLLLGDAWDTAPQGIRFAERLGGTLEVQHHMNWIRTADIDIDQMNDWLRNGPLRAPPYRMEIVRDGYPEGAMEGIARMLTIITRDAPQAQARNARTWSAEEVAAFMDHMLPVMEVVVAIARLKETGKIVGLSQLIRPKGAPRTIMTTITVVDPDHRGHGLGKWVKASSILAGLERWPESKEIETINAFTNDAMLGINHEIGFVHDHTMNTYQYTAEDLLDI